MKHELEVSVRFGETDALGHINNTSYFIYLEDARIKFFEKLGTGTAISDWRFILASTKCDFVGQGYFNQTLIVTTAVSKIGTKSFQLDHEIIEKGTSRLIAKGYAVIVHFNFEKQQSEPIPDYIREALNQYILITHNGRG
ncbi:acyl-CoA thioesterase [Litchfieldia alkalitelluris]|uniref:acyl-CoA thioesterase n=1 Tax=Litchfieldia alkalitelluris TaxID=304268 RepID=UPI0009963986|nr:thioesterase family protein [Litchfieldia alkalitelluris]